MDLQTDTLVRQGLKFSHLRLIAALEQTAQMSMAAAQLAITQPAASRLAGELERIVGTRLYHRHARGVELTEQGRHLAERARRLLRDLDDIGREVSEMGKGSRGLVRIGAVTGPALQIVLPVIRQAHASHPNIEISVTVDTSDKLCEALLAGNLDFYLGRIPENTDAAPFLPHVIGEEPICLIVRQDHPLTRQPPRGLQDCLAHDWVMQPPGGLLRHLMELYLLERGYDLPARVVSTSSVMLTLALVETTDAIAPVARYVATFFGAPAPGEPARLAHIVPLPVAEDLAIKPYSLIRLRETPLSPASQTLFEMLGRRLADLDDRPA